MTKKVDNVIKQLTGFTEDSMRRLAVNINANLIFSTPVDTGFARASWFVQAGNPLISNVVSNISNVPSQETAQKLSIDKLKFTYRLKQGKIFITNNTPYIGKLNAGSSAQAPTGFVEKSILIGIQQTVK